MSRYARRRDQNHAPIAKAFTDLGCTVVDVSHSGIAGFPDLVVGVLGRWHVVEIKNPETRYGKAGLNGNQSAFDQESRGEPMWVVSTADEAAALVQNWRRAA